VKEFAVSLVFGMAAHQIVAATATANPLIPDPPPTPPPGLTTQVRTILGWMKWGTVIAGVIGLTICALMMMVGRRSRSTVAADGAAGIPWVLLGLMLASASSAIVGVFL
jgi:hypothetical protein